MENLPKQYLTNNLRPELKKNQNRSLCINMNDNSLKLHAENNNIFQLFRFFPKNQDECLLNHLNKNCLKIKGDQDNCHQIVIYQSCCNHKIHIERFRQLLKMIKKSGLVKFHYTDFRHRYILRQITPIQYVNLKVIQFRKLGIESIQSIGFINVPHLEQLSLVQNHICSLKPLNKLRSLQRQLNLEVYVKENCVNEFSISRVDLKGKQVVARPKNKREFQEKHRSYQFTQLRIYTWRKEGKQYNQIYSSNSLNFLFKSQVPFTSPRLQSRIIYKSQEISKNTPFKNNRLEQILDKMCFN